MTWTRLPDTFNTDPALLTVSRDARLLHVEALVWCNQHLTDGRFPFFALPRVTDSPAANEAVSELLRAGVWHEGEPGANVWQLPWDLQEPSDDVARRRALNAARQAKFRDRRDRHAAGDHSICDPRHCPDVRRKRVVDKGSGGKESNALRNAVHNASVTPSRPVPSPTGTGEGADDAAAGQKAPRADGPTDETPADSTADDNPGTEPLTRKQLREILAANKTPRTRRERPSTDPAPLAADLAPAVEGNGKPAETADASDQSPTMREFLAELGVTT